MSFDSYLLLLFLITIIIRSVPSFHFSLQGVKVDWRRKAQRKITARRKK